LLLFSIYLVCNLRKHLFHGIYRILDEWWNEDEMFDWILDKCWNDYEMLIKFLMNVETMMKMLMFWNDLFEEDILLCCDEY